MKRKSKKIISVFLAILMAVTGVMPAVTAFAGDGVENFWDIQMFYKDTDTIVPEYVDETAAEKQEYVETMKEGQKLTLHISCLMQKCRITAMLNGTAICRLWLMLTKTV